MRTLGAVLVLASGGALAACDTGDASPRSSPPPVTADKALDLDNGHPLLLPNSDPGVATFESLLLRLVNDHRLGLGLLPLAESALLSSAARAHARHMITHRFFAHASPEGLTPEERLTLADVDWSAVGENIAEGYTTPQEVFERWLESPEHRANMESPRFTQGGVGYAQDARPNAEYPQVHSWYMAFLRR